MNFGRRRKDALRIKIEPEVIREKSHVMNLRQISKQKRELQNLPSNSTINIEDNKPAFDFLKIKGAPKFYDDPDSKTAGLRKITKPVFNQLKQSIYDVKSGNPMFGFAPIAFDKEKKDKSGWHLLYNDIRKNTKGYSDKLQLARAITMIHDESQKYQEVLRDLAIGKKITMKRDEKVDFHDSILSQKGSNDSHKHPRRRNKNRKNHYRKQHRLEKVIHLMPHAHRDETFKNFDNTGKDPDNISTKSSRLKKNSKKKQDQFLDIQTKEKKYPGASPASRNNKVPEFFHIDDQIKPCNSLTSVTNTIPECTQSEEGKISANVKLSLIVTNPEPKSILKLSKRKNSIEKRMKIFKSKKTQKARKNLNKFKIKLIPSPISPKVAPQKGFKRPSNKDIEVAFPKKSPRTERRKSSFMINKRVTQRLYPLSQGVVRKRFSKYLARFERINNSVEQFRKTFVKKEIDQIDQFEGVKNITFDGFKTQRENVMVHNQKFEIHTEGNITRRVEKDSLTQKNFQLERKILSGRNSRNRYAKKKWLDLNPVNPASSRPSTCGSMEDLVNVYCKVSEGLLIRRHYRVK
ncbi:unnamed protein product [Moneuplotes crassus]|uniref:Uncharacterized protein n=1 Tax=Euplotes crassus TaxID=5936 RepID=A0AAD1U5C3_EUPCR|nr:unnamed protein product [Moneuplotes crassus]